MSEILNKLQNILNEKNKISPEDLISGSSFLGINGTAVHIDPSSANVTASDIYSGYSAYDSSETLIDGTNVDIDKIIYNNQYVINSEFLMPVINVDNKFEIGINVRGYKYSTTSTNINLDIKLSSLKTLDEAYFGKNIKVKFQFYQDDTLLLDSDFGFYYLTLPSDFNYHGGYTAAIGSSTSAKIEKTNRFGCTYTFYNP